MERMSKPRRRAAIGVLLVLLMAALAVAGVYYLQQTTFSQQEWDNLLLTGTYHKGIIIDGIDVSGMTLSQARTAINDNMRARLNAMRITLEFGGKTIELTKNDFDISNNVDDVLEQAMVVAREGSRLYVRDQIKDIAENGMDFATDFTVNTEPVKSRLSEIAAGLNQPAIDATMQINKDDKDNRFSYTDEISGFAVDEDALYAAVAERIRLHDYGTIQIPVNEVPAVVTKESLQAGTVQHVTATTSFARSPYNRDSRVANIKKAVGIINGYVLKPGEEFSANTVLGPRVYELGWQPAPAIVRGGSEDQAGGGVCQVSTTMYNAVLKAGLEIVNRRGHSIQLSYVNGGLDATINTGTIDFVFRNNTAENVYIFSWVDGSEKKVRFEIYRMAFPDAYDEIKLISEKMETLYPSGEMLVTVDPAKPAGYRKVVVGRRNGAVYKTYKHFYKNGKEVGEPELVAKTTYKAYAGEIIVGPEPVAVVTPEPEEEPTQAPEEQDNPGQ